MLKGVEAPHRDEEKNRQVNLESGVSGRKPSRVVDGVWSLTNIDQGVETDQGYHDVALHANDTKTVLHARNATF